jgi:hypothetical protein
LLLFSLTFLIESSAVLLVFVSPFSLGIASLLIELASLLFILSLLISLAPLLFLSLALLLPLSPLLSSLLFLLLTGGLVLLVLALTALLFLRLSFVVPTLLLSLATLLIFFTATTFGLRLRRLLRLRPVLIPLLSFLFPRPLTVFAALRLLSPRDATGARQRDNADGRRQREATKIPVVHDYLLKERAEGKVISRSAITIPGWRSTKILDAINS